MVKGFGSLVLVGVDRATPYGFVCWFSLVCLVWFGLIQSVCLVCLVNWLVGWLVGCLFCCLIVCMGVLGLKGQTKNRN